MLPNVLKQLRRLAAVSRRDRQKPATFAVGRGFERLEDRTVPEAVPAGQIITLYQDATSTPGQPGQNTIMTLDVGVIATNPTNGVETLLYRFPDANGDNIADAFASFAANPYALTGSGAAPSAVAVQNDLVFVAVNREEPPGAAFADSFTDLYRINPADGSAAKIGTTDVETLNLFAVPDGSVVQVWQNFVAAPSPPAPDSLTNGLNRINPVDGTLQPLLTLDARQESIADVVVAPNGNVFVLTTDQTTSFSETIAPSDTYTVRRIDPANQVTTLSTANRRGDDLALAADGSLYVSWADGTFAPDQSVTQTIFGVSRVDAAAGGEQPLGSVPASAEAQRRFSKVAATPTGVFLASQQFATGTPGMFGNDDVEFDTRIFRAANGTLTPVLNTPWDGVEDLVGNADGTLQALWTDVTFTTSPPSPPFLGFRVPNETQGVSRIDVAPAAEVELYRVPVSPPNPSFGSFPEFRTVPPDLLRGAGARLTLSLSDPIDTTTTPAGDRGILVNALNGVQISAPPRATFDAVIAPLLPVAVDDAFSIEFETPITITPTDQLLLANDSTPNDSTRLRIFADTIPPLNVGRLIPNPDGSFTFTPADGFQGNFTFTYVLGDGLARSAPATITVTVNPPPRPVAAADAFNTPATTAITITPAQLLTNDTSPRGLPLTVAIAVPPPAAQGTLTSNPDGTFTFTPAAGFQGNAAFTYTVSDGDATSAPATVTITVQPPPVPTPVNDAFTTPFATPITISPAQVTANDLPAVTSPFATTFTLPSASKDGTFTLNANGSVTFAPAVGFQGTTSFTYVNANGPTTTPPGTVTITVQPAPQQPPSVDPGKLFAASTGAGSLPLVRLYTADGKFSRQFQPFESAFQGGVRVATGDFNGDGFDDVAAGAGPGGGPRVVIVDGKTGGTLASFFAFEETFTNGVFVAVGDVTGDGTADVVVGAGSLGGPRVQVRDGKTFKVVQDFFAYDSGFRGGVRIAVGDTDGDGVSEIVTGAGISGGPNVVVFNIDKQNNRTQEASFFALDPTYRGGIFVGVAPAIRGPGVIVVGPESTADPRGTLLESFFPTLANTDGLTAGRRAIIDELDRPSEVRTFFVTKAGVTAGPAASGFDPAFRGGVRVAGGDPIRGEPTIIIGPGIGSDGVIKRLRLTNQGADLETLDEILPFGDLGESSIYVG